MSYGSGTVVLPIARRVFIGALVGIYTYTAIDVVLIPGYSQLMQRWKKGSSAEASGHAFALYVYFVPVLLICVRHYSPSVAE
ncbi:hypothetical protein BESB_073960 [Besnoitia besnoiti]|uniref:Transmembrane protein n=1 Tax=Besnoitia besnoiti TaxID=94643 RepID=A0A2A9MAL7_BESBE|nr:uncharacterized protein BESB_073960 [Besnoitia besnoiti]PFH34244.1 hypothetical protein BESB_073960 [Besnoitia besnoiti]